MAVIDFLFDTATNTHVITLGGDSVVSNADSLVVACDAFFMDELGIETNEDDAALITALTNLGWDS